MFMKGGANLGKDVPWACIFHMASRWQKEPDLEFSLR